MDTHAASLADEFLADLESDEEVSDHEEDPTATKKEEPERNTRTPTDDDQTMENKSIAPTSRAEKLENISKLLFDDRIAKLKQKMAQYTQDMEQ